MTDPTTPPRRRDSALVGGRPRRQITIEPDTPTLLALALIAERQGQTIPELAGPVMQDALTAFVGDWMRANAENASDDTAQAWRVR